MPQSIYDFAVSHLDSRAAAVRKEQDVQTLLRRSGGRGLALLFSSHADARVPALWKALSSVRAFLARERSLSAEALLTQSRPRTHAPPAAPRWSQEFTSVTFAVVPSSVKVRTAVASARGSDRQTTLTQWPHTHARARPFRPWPSPTASPLAPQSYSWTTSA